jgi:ABC-2 type transport system permease protein
MAYWALARAGFRRWSSYRAATFAGIFTNVVFGFIRVAVLLAAIDVAGPIAGYDRAVAITYVWLGQGLIMTLAIWRWIDLATRIQSGDVVTDLSRPVDLQGAYLAEDLGRAAYQALARGVPPFVVGALVYDLQLPAHPSTWALFAGSLVLAVVVSFGMRFLVNLGAFWVLDVRGLHGVSSVLVTVASGFAIPLGFFPPWLERVLYLLPWASMIQLPIDVFLEKHTGVEAAAVLALQAVWVFALLGAGRLALQAAERRVAVQGG